MEQIVGYFEFLMRGGFMMYPLLLSGFVSLVVIIDRFLLLSKKLVTPRKLLGEILEFIQKGNFVEAERLASPSDSPVLDVLVAGVRDPGAPIEELEIAMQNRAELWLPVIEKRLDLLDTIITAAPLMGLLGTITGMMSSFRILSEKGVNEPMALTGGVAEALIATATGLVIALLTLVAYNTLNQKVKSLIFEMENGAARVIEARKALSRAKSK